MAVELKNRIDGTLALTLPTGSLLETPTVRNLAAAVLDVLEGRSGGTSRPPADATEVGPNPKEAVVSDTVVASEPDPRDSKAEPV